METSAYRSTYYQIQCKDEHSNGQWFIVGDMDSRAWAESQIEYLKTLYARAVFRLIEKRRTT